MPNLRIIADNAADRATLAASSTAGSLAVDNLKTDRKGAPWRALSTAARLGVTWTTSELIGGMFLPFCNLSPTATMRVRVSNEPAATNLVRASERMSDTAIWGRNGAPAVQPNAIAAPDGSLTACLITSASTGNDFVTQTLPVTIGMLVVASVFVKNRDAVTSTVGLRTTVGAPATLNWSGATLTSVLPGAGSAATVVALSGGWYWVGLSYTISETGQSFRLYGSSGANTLGSYYWGAQVVTGSASRSYYPSTDTFTSRASVGTYFGSNGLLQTAPSGNAAAGAARVQYNPLNLAAPPKLLVEPAATNAMYPSGQFESWGSPPASVRYVAAPDGTNTAVVPLPDVSSDRWQWSIPASTYANGTVLAVSWHQKTVSPTGLTGQAISLASWVGATPGAVAQLPASNGYTRCWANVTITDNTAAQVLRFYTPVVGADDLAVWGWQLELGAHPSSYIPTTTAAATRAADVATSVVGTRPAGYIDTWQSYDYDSGAVPACPAAAAKLRGFTPAQAASAYAYGGGACARHWLPAQMQALGVALDIVDAANLQGYIEAARLVVGEYWTPANNADYGASMTPTDASKHYRMDDGDLRTDIGTRARKMPLSLSAMPPADRTAMLNILRANGTAWPMLISLFPGSADAELERDHTIYGKLSSVAAMSLPTFDRYASTLELEEV